MHICIRYARQASFSLDRHFVLLSALSERPPRSWLLLCTYNVLNQYYSVPRTCLYALHCVALRCVRASVIYVHRRCDYST